MPTRISPVRVSNFRLELFLPFKLATATEKVERLFSTNYERSLNLTIAECRTLSVVAEHGTLSPSAVGNLAAMDKVKVSRATQGLIAKGLLHQRQDPDDGRARILRLTRKGTSVYARIVPLATRLATDVFGDLTRADVAALERILAKITTRLETIDS